MRKKPFAASVLCLTLLSACVSESTIVSNDRVAGPRTDMTEAARTRMSLGLNYLQRGDTSQAKYNLEKARQLAPDLSEIDNALAYYYQQVGENDQAEQAYRASLNKDSSNPDTYNNFGSFLCQINKYDEAEQLLLAAIKRPGYIRVADSYENLAFCALEQKDFSKYQQYLASSLKHNSTRATSLYNMAVLEYAMGNLTEAKNWQQRLHQLGQVSPAATFIRYLLAYHSGDVKEQQTAEKFLLSVYPASTEAAMLLSGDFSQSEPEKMRQAVKSTLLTEPVAQQANRQPKMKIVRRKAADPLTKDVSAPNASLVAENSAAAADAPAMIAAATAPVELPAEQQITPAAVAAENALTTADMVPSAQGEQPTLPAAATPDPLVQAATATQAVSSATTAALTHKVGYGETLYSIASRYRLSVSELQQLNQLDDAAFIVEGQVLRLSAAATNSPVSAEQQSHLQQVAEVPATYQVGNGESWFSVSYKYNIKLDALLKWNNMTADQPLTIGQTILLRDPATPSL